MWKTCLPRRLERRDETLEEEDCFFADLKPEGGLKVCGSMKETLDLFQVTDVSRKPNCQSRYFFLLLLGRFFALFILLRGDFLLTSAFAFTTTLAALALAGSVRSALRL